jgi:hypothetical protein
MVIDSAISTKGVMEDGKTHGRLDTPFQQDAKEVLYAYE